MGTPAEWAAGRGAVGSRATTLLGRPVRSSSPSLRASKQARWQQAPHRQSTGGRQRPTPHARRNVWKTPAERLKYKEAPSHYVFSQGLLLVVPSGFRVVRLYAPRGLVHVPLHLCLKAASHHWPGRQLPSVRLGLGSQRSARRLLLPRSSWSASSKKNRDHLKHGRPADWTFAQRLFLRRSLSVVVVSTSAPAASTSRPPPAAAARVVCGLPSPAIRTTWATTSVRQPSIWTRRLFGARRSDREELRGILFT